MGIIFYGSKETAITVDEWMVNCPCCEAHNATDSMIMSKYYVTRLGDVVEFENRQLGSAAQYKYKR